MSMLNKLHEWLEDKNCAELDDRQLGRKIHSAYRHAEPPTPPSVLLHQLKVRAQHTPQDKPEVKRVLLPPVALPTAMPTIASQASMPAAGRDSTPFHKRLWGKGQPSPHAYANPRENYRLVLGFALHQMRINFIDAGINFL